MLVERDGEARAAVALERYWDWEMHPERRVKLKWMELSGVGMLVFLEKQ